MDWRICRTPRNMHQWTRRYVAGILAGLVLGVTSTAQGPVISEIMARNATTLRDPKEFNLEDWIEIHNPTAGQLSLTGWFLTDDPLNLTKWKFPSRSIPAGGYEIVYASGRNVRISGQPAHTNFELNGDGEFLALVHKDGTTIESVFAPSFPKQYPDLAFGRSNNTGAVGYFETPTPGTANPSNAFVVVAGKVTSTKPRGRYSLPFSTTLASPTPGASIRYTIDGSKPSRSHGTLYTNPIQIAGSTVLRATAYTSQTATAKIATYSYLFYDDVLSQSATPPPGYPATWGTHQSPNGPYVRPADYGMDPAIVGSPLYRPMMMDSLESLPVISVVAEIADLFNDATGIYSNPLGEGQLWERPASVEILYPRMGRQQQVDAGIRISGRGSRLGWANAKHSLRLLFKENYGAEDLDANLYGENAALEHNTLVLRGVYNDSFAGNRPGIRERATYIRDMFVRDTQQDLGHTPSHGNFCHLYINGLYWGLYHPSERPDAAFQANYYGGKRSEWDVLKHFNGTVIDGDKAAYNAAYAIAKAGVSSATAYAQLQEYVDVVNLADYMIVNLFCATQDWPANNWYMARRRMPGEGFRFFAWDAELSLWDINANAFDVNKSQSPAFFYSQLRANAEFRQMFADRIHAALFNDGPLTTANCIARFRTRMTQVRMAVVAESARWGDQARRPTYTLLDDWDPSTAWEIQEFFPKRPAAFLSHARAAGLYPNLDAPVFSQHGGIFQNSLQLSVNAPGNPNGKIYITTNGIDPREPGGAVAASATLYSAPITLQTDTIIKARVLSGSSWSALTQALFRLPNISINEVLAKNTTGIQDPAGEREDWIEIINTTNRSITIGGMYLTDDLRNPTKWQFPAGLSMTAGSNLLVWADEDLLQPGLHANFKLSIDGEGVFLFDTDGTSRISGFHYPAQVADVSTGWFLDGGRDKMLVTFPQPTPASSNEITCGVRLYNSRSQDVHSIQLEAISSGQIGSLLDIKLEEAPPASSVGLFYSFSAGYWDGLRPANEITFLLGSPFAGRVWLQTDSQGKLALPLGIANDANLIGLRLYFQVFAPQSGAIRGSNGLELAICR
jgi:hypothetical protein